MRTSRVLVDISRYDNYETTRTSHHLWKNLEREHEMFSSKGRNFNVKGTQLYLHLYLSLVTISNRDKSPEKFEMFLVPG